MGIKEFISLRQSTHFTRNKARAVYCAENCIILVLPLKGTTVNLNSNDPGEIAMLITRLREEHRDLDHAIARLVKDPTLDQLSLTRMKKRKLKLKDWIAYLQSKLIPDLDA
jgi:hypothetical protein